MKRETITANYLKAICWSKNNTIIDWASGGEQYSVAGKGEQLGKYHFAYSFDATITSADSVYVFIYKKLGTKGLLLKNGELLREINRPYYFAETYEYPVAFVTVETQTYLVHCPRDYCQLDFEDVETGKIITDVAGRKPQDFFHSRLEVNPAGTFLLDRGWAWHPLDASDVFNIADGIANPLLLDKSPWGPDVGTEICTSSFISDTQVLVGSSEEVFDTDNTTMSPKSIAVWDIVTGKISQPVKVKGEFGNLFAINDEFAWDTYKFPKIINIKNGEIVDRDESIDSGEQASSIVHGGKARQIIFNRGTGQLAIGLENKIEVLTPFE